MDTVWGARRGGFGMHPVLVGIAPRTQVILGHPLKSRVYNTIIIKYDIHHNHNLLYTVYTIYLYMNISEYDREHG